MEVNGSGDAPPVMSICVRAGCNNPAIESKEWDKEYCSNECVVTHCRCGVFCTRILISPGKMGVFLILGLYSCLSETCLRHGAPSGTSRWGQSIKNVAVPGAAHLKQAMQSRNSVVKVDLIHFFNHERCY